ncbi:hypothetical protein DICPUDRAFT_100146 [Dictyostelium purpureum]|uniref:Uncharacterized protein n=1 Tax=Dictyostelium purpureum TaxID=5786 RepID=F1A5Y0_DICPU|nr:uncharacterized protein DICPUDRAFT_100146 [Dictyostelium purpureum]EGC28401.1 hypothetical protein DICPUDRAFT_100146 [Dictyostelium purpureum]|eukprot:XP_003295074.1 hypothetical protein DICPUDRAFT_100146 [Dictyostelium purpureum]
MNNKDNNSNNNNNNNYNKNSQEIIHFLILENENFTKENKEEIINQIKNQWLNGDGTNNKCTPIEFIKCLNLEINKIQFSENNENKILFLLFILYELVNSYLSLHIIESQELLNYYYEKLSIDTNKSIAPPSTSALMGGTSIDLFILLSLLKFPSFKKQIFEILSHLIKESYNSKIDNSKNNNNNNDNNNNGFKEIFFQSINFLIVVLKMESNNSSIVFSDSFLELLNDVFLLFEVLQTDQIQQQQVQQQLLDTVSNNYLFKFSVDCLKFIYYKMNDQVWKLFLFKYYFQTYHLTNQFSLIHNIVYSCILDILNYSLNQNLNIEQSFQDENILNSTTELLKEIIYKLLIKQEREVEIDNDSFENLKSLSLIIQNYLVVDSIFEQVQNSIIKVNLLSTKYFNLASFFYINLFSQFDIINNSNNNILLSKKNQEVIIAQINNIISISIYIPSFHSYSIFQYILTILQKQKDSIKKNKSLNNNNSNNNNNLLKVYNQLLKHIYDKLKKSCFSEINNLESTAATTSTSLLLTQKPSSQSLITQKIDFIKIIKNIDLSIEPIHFYLIILFTLPPFKHPSQLICQSLVNDLSNIDSIVELLSKVSDTNDHNLSTIQNIIIRVLSPLYNYLINLYSFKDINKCINLSFSYITICEIFKTERSREINDNISNYNTLSLKTISTILVKFIENYLLYKESDMDDNYNNNDNNSTPSLNIVSYCLELLVLNFDKYLIINNNDNNNQNNKDIEELFETLLLLYHIISDRSDSNFIVLLKFNQILTCQLQLSKSPYPLVHSTYNSLEDDRLDNPVYIMKLALIVFYKLLDSSDPRKYSLKSWNYLNNNINSIKQLLIPVYNNSNIEELQIQNKSLNIILILYFLDRIESEKNKTLLVQYLGIIVLLLKLNNIKDIQNHSSLINNQPIVNKIFTTLSNIFNEPELKEEEKSTIFNIFEYINASIQSVALFDNDQQKEYYKIQKDLARDSLFEVSIKLLFNSTIQVNREKYEQLLVVENDKNAPSSVTTPSKSKSKSKSKSSLIPDTVIVLPPSKLLIDSIIVSIVSNFPNTITSQKSISSLNHLGETIYIHLFDYINLELLEKYIYLFVDIFFPLLNSFSQSPMVLDQLSISKSNLSPPASLREIFQLNHHNRIKTTLSENILDLTNNEIIKDLVLGDNNNETLDVFIKMICRTFYTTTYLLGDDHSYHLSKGFFEKLYDLMVTFRFIYLYLLGTIDQDEEIQLIENNNHEKMNTDYDNNNNNNDDNETDSINHHQDQLAKIKHQHQQHLLRQQQLRTPPPSNNKKKKKRKSSIAKSPQIQTNLNSINQQNRIRSRHPFIDSCLRTNQENVDSNNNTNNIDTYADLEDFIIVKKVIYFFGI